MTTLEEAAASLADADRALAGRLHEYTVSLGFAPKISAMGKKPQDWKCEYKNKKKTLLILRITGGRWSARCKLYHIDRYSQVLDECSPHCIASLVKNAKGCGNHLGGCAGPVSFSVGGQTYTACRHSLLFDEITAEDAADLQKLLKCEASINEP